MGIRPTDSNGVQRIEPGEAASATADTGRHDPHGARALMGHFKTVCLKCGTVVAQCRCIGPKDTRYVTCFACACLPIGVPPPPAPESTQVTLHEGTAPVSKLPPEFIEAVDEALASISAAVDALKEKPPPVKPMWFGSFLDKFRLR